MYDVMYYLPQPANQKLGQNIANEVLSLFDSTIQNLLKGNISSNRITFVVGITVTAYT
jgi:hypothetical protein